MVLLLFSELTNKNFWLCPINSSSNDDEMPPPSSSSLTESMSSQSSSKRVSFTNSLDNEASYSDIRKPSGPQSLSEILDPATPAERAAMYSALSSQSQSKSYLKPGLSPASSHSAAEAEEKNIAQLEKEVASVTTALERVPKHSKKWFKLQAHLEKAKDELDAVKQDLSISPHTIHIIAPKGNLGLVVDSKSVGGVCIRDLDLQSPIRHQIQVGDTIIAIDDEDVQHMSPVEVGNLLSMKRMNNRRKLSIVRERVGYA